MFKIERGPAGKRVAYVRMFSGTVRPLDRLRFGGVVGWSDAAVERGNSRPIPGRQWWRRATRHAGALGVALKQLAEQIR